MTATEADLVPSWTLVAVTVKLPVAAPAVNRPAEVMAPPVAAHVTAEFAAFVTVAVNCWVPFGKRIALEGETLTPMDCAAVMVMAAVALFVGS